MVVYKMGLFRNKDDNQVPNTTQEAVAKYAQANRDANSLTVRLETDKIKEKISNYLLGISKIYKFEPTTQQLIIENKTLGSAKVSDYGYQAIMSFIECTVDKATAQGNFEEGTDLYDYLQRTREAFTLDIWVNMRKYGIKNDEMRGIINTLYALIEPFMTRTIGDGERATTRETTIQTDRTMTGSGGVHINPLSGFFSGKK